MKSLALALMLTFGSPHALQHVYRLGTSWKVIVTDAGKMVVYRDLAGCDLTLKGVILQRVDLATCAA